jgi:hypothetical protein
MNRCVRELNIGWCGCTVSMKRNGQSKPRRLSFMAARIGSSDPENPMLTYRTRSWIPLQAAKVLRRFFGSTSPWEKKKFSTWCWKNEAGFEFDWIACQNP